MNTINNSDPCYTEREDKPISEPDTTLTNELDSLLDSLSSKSPTSARDRLISTEALTLDHLNKLFGLFGWSPAINGEQPSLSLSIEGGPRLALFCLQDSFRMITRWHLDPARKIAEKLGFLEDVSLKYLPSFCYMPVLTGILAEDASDAIEPDLVYAQYDYFSERGVTFNQLAFVCKRFTRDNRLFAVEAYNRGFLHDSYIAAPYNRITRESDRSRGWLAEGRS